MREEKGGDNLKGRRKRKKWVRAVSLMSMSA